MNVLTPGHATSAYGPENFAAGQDARTPPTVRPPEHSEPFLAWPGWNHLKFAAVVSLIGAVWFVIVYGGCDAFTAHRVQRLRVHLDAELLIPFIPETVLLYSSIYLLFLAAPFILRQRQDFLRLAIQLDLTILLAGIGFLLIPAQLAFRPESDLGIFPGLFRFADKLNLTYNLVPSLHVALSVACVAAFAPRASCLGAVCLWAWAVAISASTLLTHQHHVLDVLAGWALGLSVFWAFARWKDRSPAMDSRALPILTDGDSVPFEMTAASPRNGSEKTEIGAGNPRRTSGFVRNT